MLKFTRALHIIGIAMFFGSILGHAITGLAEGLHGNAPAVLVSRQIIDAATWYLTLPGLALAALTGVGLIIMRERPLRNLGPHLLITTLILVNAIVFLFPVGQAILSAANDLSAGNDLNNTLSKLQDREAIFGAINILLCIAAIFIGVIKPGSDKA